MDFFRAPARCTCARKRLSQGQATMVQITSLEIHMLLTGLFFQKASQLDQRFKEPWPILTFGVELVRQGKGGFSCSSCGAVSGLKPEPVISNRDWFTLRIQQGHSGSVPEHVCSAPHRGKSFIVGFSVCQYAENTCCSRVCREKAFQINPKMHGRAVPNPGLLMTQFVYVHWALTSFFFFLF